MTKYVLLTVTEDEQDARDLYSERGLACAVCGCTNSGCCPGGCSWVLPGLCSKCAGRVVSAAPSQARQQSLFHTHTEASLCP